MYFYANQKLRLPVRSTQESLEHRFNTVLKYGDKVLLSGYYYMGKDSPSYYGAVYQFLEGQSCDDDIEFLQVSPGFFADDGHAIQWCLSQIKEV